MHSVAVGGLNQHIKEACVRALIPARGTKIYSGVEQTLENVPGIYGSCAIMKKCPDISVHLMPVLKRHPFLAAEVIFRNQSVPVMLEEAAVLLSPYTAMVYLIQVKILETGNPRRLSGFRIRLCQRMAAIDGPEAQAGLSECRPRPWMARDGPEPSREEVERLYHYAVLSDFRIGLANIHDARLQIPVDALERHYEISGIFVERHITLELKPYLEEICAYADDLSAMGLYHD